MAKKLKPEVNLNSKKLEDTAQKNIKIVESLCPNRVTYKRKIQHLWDNHYRVNFHDKYNGNYIKYSFFVSIPLPAPVPKITSA